VEAVELAPLRGATGSTIAGGSSRSATRPRGSGSALPRRTGGARLDGVTSKRNRLRESRRGSPLQNKDQQLTFYRPRRSDHWRTHEPTVNSVDASARARAPLRTCCRRGPRAGSGRTGS
jgi:hypothetical protein